MTDTTQYLNRLDAELARAGIHGARRKRIIAEFADHLRCDPDADLGDPVALATQFADELGTSFARTAAFRAFLAPGSRRCPRRRSPRGNAAIAAVTFGTLTLLRC